MQTQAIESEDFLRAITNELRRDEIARTDLPGSCVT
jgi:hypothetical protein